MQGISIIIPNYNNAKWLSACILSCLSQKGRFKKEIIVVDDHSTDDSWQILQHFQSTYPDEVFIYKNPKKGSNEARNFGFTHSKGRYIQWLDSDDLLLPGKLEAQFNYLESNKDIDISYSDWRMDFYEGEEVKREEILIEKEYDFYLAELLQNKWQPNLSYLVRYSLALRLHQLKGWNVDTKIGQDREYFTMAAILGASFKYVPGVFAVYNRWSIQSISNKLSYYESSKQSLLLNHRFYEEIKKSTIIEENRKCLKILNSQLLKALFYHPQLKTPRIFWFWNFSLKSLPFKIALISPLLYVLHLIKRII